MPRIPSPHDSASLFYRDYVPGTPLKGTKQNDLTLVFLHGWPMSSRMWQQHLLQLCQDHGFRCVAPDRRGFGDSEWNGRCSNDAAKNQITYETFADDVIFLLEELAVGNFVFVASSMGCGESLLAWERSPYCQQHCKGFIWIGCNLPYPIQSSSNPTAPSIELWQSIIASFRTARPQFVAEALPGIFGVPAGASISTKTLEHYERIVAQADGLAIERTNNILVERDFTPSVRRLGKQGELGVRLLLLHGDSDTGMPYEASAGVVKELVPRAQVKLYEKGGHGLQETHAEQLLQDILDFARSDGGEKRT